MKVIHGLKFLVVFTLFLFISACGGGSSSSSSGDPVVDLTPTPSSPKLELSYEENIAETLYYNDASSSAQFTYKPVFVFKNTSGSSVTVNTVDVSDTAYLTNVAYQCNGVSKALPCTLSADQTFSVNGTLADFSEANNSKTLSLTLKDAGSDTLGQYEITTQFVKYLADHVAVRTINKNAGATALYLAAAYGGNTVNFAANSDGLYVGTKGTTMEYMTDDFSFPSKDGGVVYIPDGSSGTLYLSFEQFTYEATPSVNDPRTPGFFTAEFTYLNQVPSPPPKCTASDGTCEQLTLDTTYVNYMQYFGSASTLGTSSYLPDSVLTGNGYAGATEDAISQGTEAVYKAIYDVYETFDVPWKYVEPATPDLTANYFATSKTGGTIPADTTTLYAPIQLFDAGQASNAPMGNDYYTSYVNALWEYMKTNPIFVDASSVENPAWPGCILKGEVVTASPQDLLKFQAVDASKCPDYAYVVPALVGSFSSCTGSTAPVSGGTDCADTPDLTFSKFNTCGFVTAAGSESCTDTTIDASTFVDNTTLWGPNGTFRAIVGRAIVSYQAAGLLPICSGSGMTPISESSPMNQANSRAAVATGKAFQNPSCLELNDDTKPVYNLYTKELSKYVQAYTYSYGDFLGMDATMTYSRNAFSGNDSGETCATTPDSQFCNLPRALPITLKIH